MLEVAKRASVRFGTTTPKTVVDFVRSFATARADRGLYFYREGLDGAEFLSYPALYARVAGAVDHFRAHGVRPGLPIIFPFEHDVDIIVSFFALIGMGALPLSVRPHLPGATAASYVEFIERLARRYQVQHLLEAESVRRLRLPLPNRVPVASAELTSAHDPDLVDRSAREPGAIAFVQFSSGSTSFPKGVPIGHAQIMANLAGICRIHGGNEDDVGCSWLPLYHDMGLVGSLMSSFLPLHDFHLTSPVHYLEDPVEWFARMSRIGMQLHAMPNFGIDYCLKRLRSADPADLQGWNLESVRAIYIGSEPIHVDHLLEFAELLRPYGLRRSALKPCYGMAEAVLMISSLAIDEDPVIRLLPDGRKQISVGRVLPGFELRLRAESGQLCGEGEEGEIELRGGTLASSYYDEEASFLGSDQFYSTGDLGQIHDGLLYVTGRIGDRFKINAQSYFSSEFEQAVESLPFVRTGRSAALPIDGRVVVLAEVDRMAALRHLEEHRAEVSALLLTRFGVKVPSADILFIRHGQIEKTSSGKLRRNALAERYRRGEIRLASPTGLQLDRLRRGWARFAFKASRVFQTSSLRRAFRSR